MATRLDRRPGVVRGVLGTLVVALGLFVAPAVATHAVAPPTVARAAHAAPVGVTAATVPQGSGCAGEGCGSGSCTRNPDGSTTCTTCYRYSDGSTSCSSSTCSGDCTGHTCAGPHCSTPAVLAAAEEREQGEGAASPITTTWITTPPGVAAGHRVLSGGLAGTEVAGAVAARWGSGPGISTPLPVSP